MVVGPAAVHLLLDRGSTPLTVDSVSSILAVEMFPFWVGILQVTMDDTVSAGLWAEREGNMLVEDQHVHETAEEAAVGRALGWSDRALPRGPYPHSDL